MLRGVGALVTIGAAIVLFIVLAGRHPRPSPATATTGELPAVADAVRLPVPAALTPPSWTVRQQVGSSQVLVVDLEAAHPDQALDIAREIVSLVGPQYREVLMYFHRPGRFGSGDLPPRRIQWTPTHRFVQMDYEAMARK